MKTGKKLLSKKEEVKDRLIEEYQVTIDELIQKVKSLEKEIKKLKKR